jgi:Family of unknown function (DUF5683)
MKKLLFLIIVINFSTKIQSQSISVDTNKSVKLENFKKVLTKQDSIKKGFKIIPRMSTIHSALVPGWGQIDNRQYWKLPIVAGAFGTVAFFIIYNDKRYQYYKNYLKDTYIPIFPSQNPPSKVFVTLYNTYQKDGDGNEIKDANGNPVPVTREFNQDQLNNAVSGYRRNRDYSYLFLLVAWAANIVDANVTAHLKTFDVTDDISLKIQPTLTNPEFGMMPIYGAKLTLAFK